MKFEIKGKSKLKGEIKISGSKNAATPIISASLLIKGDCFLSNVPRIKDVENLLKILKKIGAEIKWEGKNELRINTKNAEFKKDLDKMLFKKMRSSILLLGPFITRFKKGIIPEPGGCIIGNRPLDTHINAFRKLNVGISTYKDKTGDINFEFNGKNIKSTKVILDEFSVTATENIILASVLTKGTTIIKKAAIEPHIIELIKFLDLAGAKIEILPSHTIKIQGVKTLNGISYKICPDYIETGTFLVLGSLIGEDIILSHTEPSHLENVIEKLKEIGGICKIGENEKYGKYIRVKKAPRLKSFKIQTMPYPGFPTDLQSCFGVLATQADGISLIYETLYENRINYINELIRMGAKALICDPHRALIVGPSKLYGRNIRSFDLRAGASLIIAGLIAEGKTTISEIENIFRGYENIDKKLKNIGAEIKVIKY